VNDTVIVSRHPAAIEFIAGCLSTEGLEGIVTPSAVEIRVRADVDAAFGEPGSLVGSVPVLTQAGPDDVRDRTVYGNVPLHLAALAREVYAIEFAGTPPRGQEYTLTDMLAAGSRLVPYVVRQQTAEQARHDLLEVLRAEKIAALAVAGIGDGMDPDFRRSAP
jgi:hypothetical protein